MIHLNSTRFHPYKNFMFNFNVFVVHDFHSIIIYISSLDVKIIYLCICFVFVFFSTKQKTENYKHAIHWKSKRDNELRKS